MSLSLNVTPVFLDKVISLMVPLFLTAAAGHTEAARAAAESTLASYDVETEEEIRLAAEITSFGFGALEALARSMDPDLPLNAVLRLRGSANTLHRSGHQCQRALDKLHKERHRPMSEASAQTAPILSAPILSAPVQTTWPEQPADAAETPPLGQPSTTQPHPESSLSRQQRRAMQRAVDKAQRRQAEQARRDAMRASRLAPAFATPSERNTLDQVRAG